MHQASNTGNTQKRRHKNRSGYGAQTVRFQREIAKSDVRGDMDKNVVFLTILIITQNSEYTELFPYKRFAF